MYTIQDLQNVEKALMQLALGEKVVSFSRSSAAGSQMVTFNQAQVTDLERLRMQIQRYLHKGKSDYLVVTSSKGL
jgi:low affinity Fe/Cu permease